MKQLKFTFLLCLFLIASNHIHAQLDTAQKISLSLNNASLFDLVKSIEDQTEYRFYFDTAQLSKQTYSIEISKAPLSQVLVTLLTPYKIYAIIDKEGYIFLSKDPLLNLMLPNAYFTGIQKNNVSGNINNFIEYYRHIKYTFYVDNILIRHVFIIIKKLSATYLTLN